MGEIVHRRKNFGGVMTAQQVHAELAWWKKKCDACGGPPALRIQVFVLLSDMSTTVREHVLYEIAHGRVHTVPFVQGRAVRVSFMHACSICAPVAERAAARGAPSYAIVDIDRGPGPDSPIVGVTSQIA